MHNVFSVNVLKLLDGIEDFKKEKQRRKDEEVNKKLDEEKRKKEEEEKIAQEVNELMNDKKLYYSDDEEEGLYSMNEKRLMQEHWDSMGNAKKRWEERKRDHCRANNLRYDPPLPPAMKEMLKKKQEKVKKEKLRKEEARRLAISQVRENHSNERK